MIEFPTVETARLRLERWDHAVHGPGFAAMNGQREVMRFLGGDEPMTRAESDEESARISAHWNTYGFGLWAAVLKDETIGFVGLCHPLWFPSMAERVEVGWRLRVEAWGHGYATEGARAALTAGFETLGLDEIVAFVHPENGRSLAVTRRLGMVEEAEVPHPSREHTVKILARRHDPHPDESRQADESRDESHDAGGQSQPPNQPERPVRSL
jgi:RimJ/RimL family protein N-acetyltransferase